MLPSTYCSPRPVATVDIRTSQNLDRFSPNILGAINVYQGIGGRPPILPTLPVLTLHRPFLLPLASQLLNLIQLNNENRQAIAEEVSAILIQRSRGDIAAWLKIYTRGNPFTGSVNLFSSVDIHSIIPHLPRGSARHIARPVLYICLSAPPNGARFFSPGYPASAIRLSPGDAILCQSVGDEILHAGPGQATYLRLYGRPGPESQLPVHLTPVYESVNPPNPSKAVAIPPSPISPFPFPTFPPTLIPGDNPTRIPSRSPSNSTQPLSPIPRSSFHLSIPLSGQTTAATEASSDVEHHLKSHWQDEARNEMFQSLQPRTEAQERRIMVQSQTIEEQSQRIEDQNLRMAELEELIAVQSVEIRGIREKVSDFEIQLLDSSGEQNLEWISRGWMGIETDDSSSDIGGQERESSQRSSSVISLEEGEIRVKSEPIEKIVDVLYNRHGESIIGVGKEEVQRGRDWDEDLGDRKRRRI